MLDNPFVLLLLVCGSPILLVVLGFAAGWWAARRDFRLVRGGGNGRRAETGIGYAVAAPGSFQEAPAPRGTGPLVDRIARLQSGKVARQ